MGLAGSGALASGLLPKAEIAVTNIISNLGPARCSSRPASFQAGKITTLLAGGFVYLTAFLRARGENRVDYRYDYYKEDAGRIEIETHGVYWDTALSSSVSLQGNFVNDAVSGATPTGAPPLPGQTSVAMAEMHDMRQGGFLQLPIKLSNHTLTPQFSVSQEHDYRSIGAALNDAIDFNEKNTTVSIGASHSFDHILPNPGEYYSTPTSPLNPVEAPIRKDDTDVLLGLTQLLDPNTIATLNLTVGYASGFLNDPYKRVLFDNYPYYAPYPFTVWPENRPDHKLRQVVFTSLSHYFDAVRGAAELTYRFSHDSFGIVAHTTSLQWNQKIGSRLVLSPMFRFHKQSAASFYGTHFAGDPSDPASPIQMPAYYSADYRLSALNSFTYGVEATVKVWKSVSIGADYKRYEMYGTDGFTAAAQYPKAHVGSIGLTVGF